jgi:hypothetical protein
LDVKENRQKLNIKRGFLNVFLHHPGCFPGSRKERIRKRKVRLGKEEIVMRSGVSGF